MMNKLLFSIIVYLTINHINTQTLDDCLKNDSIACVQKILFRKAKELLDRDSYELVGGISLVKRARDNGGRAADYEREVEETNDVVQRQSALESYVGQGIGDFVSGRSLRINFMPIFEKVTESARALTSSIPAEVKQAADEVFQGRGKKKTIKMILPLLLAAKLKLGLLATLGYFGIALLAKKAILAALVSIAISAFLGLRNVWAKSGSDVTTAYNAGGWNSGLVSSGWSAPFTAGSGSGWASSGWDDAHGAFSAPGQAVAGYHRR